MRAHAGVIGVVLLLAIASPAAARLPLLAVPEHYRLTFAPDLAAERFDGHAVIRVRVLASTSRLVLNAVGLTIERATVAAGGVQQTAVVTTDPEAQTMTLRVPVRLAPGEAEIEIRYSGPLTHELRGFYLGEAEGRKYAATQLEATDARRMFPSFDEPALKATFDIAAVVDRDDVAISNGPVQAVEPGPGPDQKTVRFATTPRMSTYLVALAIGDFVCKETRAGDVPLAVCSTPSRRHLLSFAAEAATAALRYFDEYFAIDYPFAKLSLVALPDFAAGAMENTGAVFFRESLLLVDDDAALATRKRVALVIAHELAHQWFGDLVTMRWWDDLWLNEGFATWIETKAVSAWRPEWHVELDALQAAHGAMSVDALASTRPVRQRAESPPEIEALFDAIAYDKAAAVLGMVEAFVGPPAFRAGVDAYLAEHQYANATAEDFWRTVTRITGRPVDRIMRSFVDRPGVPLVTIASACRRSATQVALSQERFQRDARPSGPPLPWTVPVCLAPSGGAAADECELLEAPGTALELPGCPAVVIGNAGARGYYRTRHDEETLRKLGATPAFLSAAERLMLVADEWALLRAGRTDLDRFLTLSAALAPDLSEPQVIAAIGERLQFIHEYVARGEVRGRLERWVRDRFGPPLSRQGQAPPANAAALRRRAALLDIVATVGRDPRLVADARAMVERYLEHPAAGRLDATLLDTLVGVAAPGGDAALYDAYVRAAERAATPEARYRFLYGLAAFRDPALVRRTIDYALSPAVRTQDRALLLGRILSNPAARDLAWEAIERRWPEIESGLGAFGGTGRIVEALDAFCDRAHMKSIRAFFAARPVPGAQRTLAQTLERIDACTALVDAQQPVLANAMAAQATAAR